VLGTRGPSGSVLVPDDGMSQVWAVAPAILVAAVLVWPRFSSRAPGPDARPYAADAAGSDAPAPAGTGSRAA